MKPKSSANPQGNLFTSSLRQIINMQHELVLLEKIIDWKSFDEYFGDLYHESQGAPGLPTRLMVGLHYLKYAFNFSDENTVAQFVENPYWQFFCGYDHFQIQPPCDPSSMSRWRGRIGKNGGEKMLQETIVTAIQSGVIKKQDCKRVNVDTTVQEKNITFPTDARLYERAMQKLVDAAQTRGIKLRQPYSRIRKKLLRQTSLAKRGKNAKVAKAALRKLKTRLGRLIRDVERKTLGVVDEGLSLLLERAKAILVQQKNDKNKIYSFHEDVECIAKGKAHKKYEFGNKASFATTSRNGFVLSALSFRNEFDGDTLKATLEQAQEFSGQQIIKAYCDNGYRGRKRKASDIGVELILSNDYRSLSSGEKKYCKHRSAIEPEIGHMKNENRLGRNFLKGYLGDALNIVFAGCGHNIRKVLAVLKEIGGEFFMQLYFLLLKILIRPIPTVSKM